LLQTNRVRLRREHHTNALLTSNMNGKREETAMKYSLNISIDSAAVRTINQTRQRVTLVKSKAGGTTLAWVTFKPMENNLVTWEENYLIYATTTALQEGAVLDLQSQTDLPVQTGFVYTLQDGVFNKGDGGTKGLFAAVNQDENGENFGLAQTAIIHGKSVLAPLNAIPVNHNQNVTFEPIETVSIYLSNIQDNGVVISDVSGDALTVELTSVAPNATIGFNDGSNTFFLQGTSAQAPARPARRAAQPQAAARP